MATLYTDIAQNQRDGLNFPGGSGGLTAQPGAFNDPVLELGTCTEIVAVYTMLGTEAAADIIRIARIGQGVVVDPVRSSLAGNGAATTLTISIGDDDTDAGLSAARPTRYSAAINVAADMSATTAASFAGGTALITPQSTIDDPTWLTATLATCATPVAAKKLIFRIKLNDNR